MTSAAKASGMEAAVEGSFEPEVEDNASDGWELVRSSSDLPATTLGEELEADTSSAINQAQEARIAPDAQQVGAVDTPVHIGAHMVAEEEVDTNEVLESPKETVDAPIVLVAHSETAETVDTNEMTESPPEGGSRFPSLEESITNATKNEAGDQSQVDAVLDESAAAEAGACSPVHGEQELAPPTDPESTRGEAESAPSTQPEQQSTDDAIAELQAMGFSAEQAREALSATDGNVDKAAEYLIDGPPPEQFHQVKTVLRQVRQWLVDLKDQVQETVRRRQEQRHADQEAPIDETDQRLEHLQKRLAEMRAKLTEVGQQCKDRAQAAADGVKKRLDDKYGEGWEQDRLRKLDSQLAEAEHFIRDTLHAVRERASSMLSAKMSTQEGYSASEAASGAEGSSATDNSRADEAHDCEETVSAAAAASESAAAAAIATLDEFLNEQGESSAQGSVSAEPAVEVADACPSHITEPVLATPVQVALCTGDCGRPAAPGYPTCCRTCSSSGGSAHGPTCQVRNVGRRIAGSLFQGRSQNACPAETDQNPASSSGDATAQSVSAQGEQNQDSAATAAVNNEDVESLAAMGFAAADIQDALAANQGSIEMALDHLLAKTAD